MRRKVARGVLDARRGIAAKPRRASTPPGAAARRQQAAHFSDGALGLLAVEMPGLALPEGCTAALGV